MPETAKLLRGASPVLFASPNTQKVSLLNLHQLAYRVSEQKPQPRSHNHVLLAPGMQRGDPLAARLHVASTAPTLAALRERIAGQYGPCVTLVMGEVGACAVQEIVEQVGRGSTFRRSGAGIVRGNVYFRIQGMDTSLQELTMTVTVSAKGEILSVILEIVHPSSLMQSAGEKGIMVKIKPAVLFDMAIAYATSLAEGQDPPTSTYTCYAAVDRVLLGHGAPRQISGHW